VVIDGFTGEISGVAREGLTVTVVIAEVFVTGVAELSITLTSYISLLFEVELEAIRVNEFVVDEMPEFVCRALPEVTLLKVTVYGGVPVAHDAVKVSYWPESRVELLAVIVGVVRGGVEMVVVGSVVVLEVEVEDEVDVLVDLAFGYT
jgi:hypothetical protein